MSIHRPAATRRRSSQRSQHAYRHGEAAPPRRSRARSLLPLPVAALVAALALSPAGATVGRLLGRAFGVAHAAAALSSLPTSGRLLLSDGRDAWTVAADGSIVRLGPFEQASWSPHGSYVAAVHGGRLAAIDPRGRVQWTLVHGASDPRWYSPSGYRLAYLSGDELRVVAGDGSGDHLLATGVERVAPAWRPGHPYQLAYVSAASRLVVREADTGEQVWSVRAGAGVEQLEWLPGGRRLLVIARSSVRVLTPGRAGTRSVAVPAGGPVVDAAVSPNGRELALVLRGSAGGVYVDDLAGRRPQLRPVLAGARLADLDWSPDGRWLVVSWPAADQLVFVRALGGPRIAAVSGISHAFGGSLAGFPQLDGWCCAAARTRPRPPVQALVTAETENRLLVVDLPSGLVARQVPLPPDPEDIATSSPDGGLAIVVSSSAGKVTVLDPSKLRVLKTFGGFQQPHIVEVSPDGQHAYVTDDSRGTVTVIRLSDMTIRGTVHVGLGAHHLAFAPDQRQAWVALGESATRIAILDTGNIEHPRVTGYFEPGFPAHDLAFSPSGRQVWVSSSAGPDVTVLDARDHRVLYRVPAGPPPQHIVFAGPSVYITTGYGSQIERVSAATGRVLARTSAPYGSFELAAADGYVVTSSLLRGTLAIYTPNLRLLRTVVLAPATREVAITRAPT